MKDKKVCTGCMYKLGRTTSSLLQGTCGYITKTGRSRLKIERENGGYKTDSCICYKKA